MFGFVAKITKGKILTALAVILVPMLIFSGVYISKTAEKKDINVTAKTAEQRISFLKQYGWDAEDGSETEKTAVIPSEFDNIYEAYNNIQKNQGFDLEAFKGKKVSLYTIKINNYPKNSEFVYATLLVKNGEVVGGDVHSTELDGFMHGFKSVS